VDPNGRRGAPKLITGQTRDGGPPGGLEAVARDPQGRSEADSSALSTDLAVMIFAEQAGEQGSKPREQCRKQMPEHASRMTGLEGEVNTDVENSPTRPNGPRRHAD